MSTIYHIESEIDSDLAGMETSNEQRNYLKDLAKAIDERLDDIPEE